MDRVLFASMQGKFSVSIFKKPAPSTIKLSSANIPNLPAEIWLIPSSVTVASFGSLIA